MTGARRAALALVLALVPASSAVESRAPMVLELFTSQGCSSCPEADRLLSTWGMKQFQTGAALPLAFNVDYWNYLGWKDVFSAPVYSQRQRRYDEALGVRTYTPQLVVAGREALVGSDGAAAEKALRRYSTAPARARISVESLASPRARLKIGVEFLEKSSSPPRVMLAVFENGLVTDVRSGENAGRALRSDFVVRSLRDLGPLPEAGTPYHRFIDEAWDPAWRKDSSGAAVFLQDPKTMEILAVGWIFPLA